MEFKVELWQAALAVVLLAVPVSSVWFWVLRSIKRMPTDIKDYFARLKAV